MNYTKINIGGKERGAKLGLGFLERITKAEGVSLQELFTKFEQDVLFFLPKMIYYSVLYNDERAGNKADYNLDDVFDWIDEIGINSEPVMSFIEAFKKSIEVHFVEKGGKPKPQKTVAQK
ncbi:TPA: hypothetical protein JRX92_003578 [Elizabethkingia anophelis]|nr:hypothetical protein [Elizabethkingia anophelis]HAY3545172.1 hypothetical protein [Elizabethkingia anophelis]